MVHSRFGEICFCCCFLVLPGTAWVLLNYVLHTILCNSVYIWIRVRIALAKNAGCLQNGSHMLLSLLASFCKTSMKQDESQVNSSMCDPFCKHPAFLAKAILTLPAWYNTRCKKAMPGWRLDRPFARLPSFPPCFLCSSMRHSHSLLALKLQSDRSLGLPENAPPPTFASHELMLLRKAGFAGHLVFHHLSFHTHSGLVYMMSG